jgi:hypothetical protein
MNRARRLRTIPGNMEGQGEALRCRQVYLVAKRTICTPA